MTELDSPLCVPVSLGERSYDILIGAGVRAGLGHHIRALSGNQRAFIVSDETVWSLHGEALESGLLATGVSVSTWRVPAGEGSKNWDMLGRLLDHLLEEGAGRDDVLVAFGGGVVGDLAGLAAALLKRGMTLVQMPTTLLAQVDSSVGGKTAVNTSHGKNLVGAFYQPSLVLADTDFLVTLPPRERRAGYAEIIKYGLIDDPDFLTWLEGNGPDVLALIPSAVAEAVAVSCRAKARIVALDERESGARALLNLGHTFGHTLEAANGYGPALLHGEAVGTGMALALRYSARLDLMPEADAERGSRLIRAGGLETELSQLAGGPYRVPELIEAMRQDKKVRAGRLPLILATGLGRAFIHEDADLSDVAAFLSEELQTR